METTQQQGILVYGMETHRVEIVIDMTTTKVKKVDGMTEVEEGNLTEMVEEEDMAGVEADLTDPIVVMLEMVLIVHLIQIQAPEIKNM